MPNDACIAAPLNQKLEKVQPKTFRGLLANKLLAIHELQYRLTLLPILAFLFAGGCYILDANAYNIQVGCVLLEEQPDGTTKQV